MSEQNNQETTNNANKKTLTKSIRNRIVGLLVLLSIVLIMVPFLLKSNDDFKVNRSEDAIAITKDGAVTNDDGQLVSAIEHDYSDLLDPEDDLSKDDKKLPSVNETATLTTKRTPQADSPVPEHMPKYEELEEVKPTPSTFVPVDLDDESVSAQNNSKSSDSNDVLRSNRNKDKKPSTAKKNEVAKKIEVKSVTPKNTGSKPAVKVNSASKYAAQVGVFSKKAGADQVVAALKHAGFRPTTQKDNVNGSVSIRVYAAVSANREDIVNICKSVSQKTAHKNCIVHPL